MSSRTDASQINDYPEGYYKLFDINTIESEKNELLKELYEKDPYQLSSFIIDFYSEFSEDLKTAVLNIEYIGDDLGLHPFSKVELLLKEFSEKERSREVACNTLKNVLENENFQENEINNILKMIHYFIFEKQYPIMISCLKFLKWKNVRDFIRDILQNRDINTFISKRIIFFLEDLLKSQITDSELQFLFQKLNKYKKSIQKELIYLLKEVPLDSEVLHEIFFDIMGDFSHPDYSKRKSHLISVLISYDNQTIEENIEFILEACCKIIDAGDENFIAKYCTFISDKKVNIIEYTDASYSNELDDLCFYILEKLIDYCSSNDEITEFLGKQFIHIKNKDFVDSKTYQLLFSLLKRRSGFFCENLAILKELISLIPFEKMNLINDIIQLEYILDSKIFEKTNIHFFLNPDQKKPQRIDYLLKTITRKSEFNSIIESFRERFGRLESIIKTIFEKDFSDIQPDLKISLKIFNKIKQIARDKRKFDGFLKIFLEEYVSNVNEINFDALRYIRETRNVFAHAEQDKYEKAFSSEKWKEGITKRMWEKQKINLLDNRDLDKAIQILLNFYLDFLKDIINNWNDDLA